MSQICLGPARLKVLETQKKDIFNRLTLPPSCAGLRSQVKAVPTHRHRGDWLGANPERQSQAQGGWGVAHGTEGSRAGGGVLCSGGCPHLFDRRGREVRTPLPATCQGGPDPQNGQNFLSGYLCGMFFGDFDKIASKKRPEMASWGVKIFSPAENW